MSMTTDEIRSCYLNFFVERGAKLCPSDSLVPANDPTLLFTGAGMNQFKDYFLGIGKMDFRRATSCQKCIRTGDIMNVGVTPSHHTLFEMLGNFSFGDYFKTEAIEWAWEFLTGTMKIPEARLQVSVHENDDEAFGIWKNKMGLPESKISRLGDHDNFWPADAPKLGPNGPCGPCSEIFFDRGEQFGCGAADCGITCDCRRHVEIWNLVFTQFDRQSDGSLPPLPQCNIDTGMGLERMASCMQGTVTNMDIDIFQPLTAKIAEMAETSYGKEKAADVLIRRIADHARAVTFCIGDGVVPANSHRGYVLKRLLRRAVLDGRNLGIRGAFLSQMVPVVGKVMNKPYPEILERAESIAEIVASEEDKFLSTLEKGLTLIDMATENTKKAGKAELDGRTAFELYDTYGFPYELAEEVVEKNGLTIDREGFDTAMAEAKEKARAGAKMKGDVFAKGPVTEVKKRTGGTEFLGYDNDSVDAKVIAIISGDSLVGKAGAGTEVTIVLDKTSFYGESGGQVGDTGSIVGPGNLVIEIDDTQKIDGIHFHVGRIESGEISEGMAVSTQIDTARRLDIRRNHTVTHLLHKALHEVLGPKAEQKGSYVSPERMRFDFQHGQKVTDDECRRIEEIVNKAILADFPVVTEVMDVENAKKKGAMALFGEKYGASVRVVQVGDGYSTELCGGTHIHRTAPIGSFRILSEESVSSGVRRIEGVTGIAAYRTASDEGKILATLANELKVPAVELAERIKAILEDAKNARKELNAIKAEAVSASLSEITPVEIGEAKVVAQKLDGVLGKDLAAASDTIAKKLGDNGVTVLVGTDGDKVGLVIKVGKALAPAKLKAGDMVKELAPMVGGGGGGRPEMAQAGGKNPAGIDDLLKAVPELIQKALS